MLAHAKNEFDVCLCDLQMPVMDGIECTRRYREYEKLQRHRKSNPNEHRGEEFLLRNGNPMSPSLEGQSDPDIEKGQPERRPEEIDPDRLPIIGMSANNDTLSKDAAIEAGMNLFIAKPFTIKDLENVLDKFKSRSRK
jgi:CheY-like chemotaxis protein